MASLDSARDEFWINGKFYPRRTINDIDIYCLNKDEFFVIFKYLNFCDIKNLCLVNKELNKYIKEFFKHYNTHLYKFNNKTIRGSLNPYSNVLLHMLDTSNYDTWIKKNISNIKTTFQKMFYITLGDSLTPEWIHKKTIYYVLKKMNIPSYNILCDIKFITYLILNRGFEFILMKKKYKLNKTNIRQWKDLKNRYNEVVNNINKHFNNIFYRTKINIPKYKSYLNNIKHILPYNQCVAFTLDYFINRLLNQQYNNRAINKKLYNTFLQCPEFKIFLNHTLIQI